MTCQLANRFHGKSAAARASGYSGLASAKKRRHIDAQSVAFAEQETP